jgi:L-ascorbate metabolism protein UlaG (beta-lactamase superfamily)
MAKVRAAGLETSDAVLSFRSEVALMILRFLMILLLWSGMAQAQERTPSHCVALAEATPGIQYLVPASLGPVAPETVRIHYIAHASFLIRTHGGLNMVTDYTGFIGTTPMIPDVVTMNHAHGTHWTSNPDPAIPHVLPGWGPFGEGIDHHLDLGEVLVRNVSTDIRSDFSGVEEEGNSIFVFEVAGLCIGHLGHLHHEPDAAQYAALGRLDVVMAPVDGGYTLDLDTMTRVLKRLRSSVVIPMHWFSFSALDYFLAGMSDEFAVVEVGGPALDMSLDRLPSRPTIMVLRPAYLTDGEE